MHGVIVHAHARSKVVQKMLLTVRARAVYPLKPWLTLWCAWSELLKWILIVWHFGQHYVFLRIKMDTDQVTGFMYLKVDMNGNLIPADQEIY